MPDEEQGNWGRNFGLGLEVAVGVGLGALIGWWLDQKYGWGWALPVGAMVGLAAGLYLLVKEAIRMNKD